MPECTRKASDEEMAPVYISCGPLITLIQSPLPCLSGLKGADVELEEKQWRERRDKFEQAYREGAFFFRLCQDDIWRS